MIVNGLVDRKNIDAASHWWTFEKISDSIGRVTATEDVQSSLSRAKIILPFMFDALNALYVATRQIPVPWTNNMPFRYKDGGAYNLIISLPLSAEHYQLLRAVLSLSRDIYSATDSISKSMKRSGVSELEPILEQLFKNSNQFRDARNFFTHLDEVLSKPDKHGITGALITSTGTEFTSTTKGAEYIILAGDKLYFTYKARNWNKARACEVDVGKAAFNSIFNSARMVYKEITSFKVHRDTYNFPPFNAIFPI